MDSEQRGDDEWESFERAETEPDGFKAFKKTLKDLIGLKSKKKKGRHGVPYETQMDDDDRGHVTNDTKSESETASNIPEVLQNLQINELSWSYPESPNSRTQQNHHDTAEDTVYNFRHEKRGFAVLVINSEFDTQSKRENAVWDIYYMRKMFFEMGFDVKILQNLTSNDLLFKLKEIQQQITKESDCFACVISSHGMEGQAKVSGSRGREPFVRTEHFVYTKDGVVRTSELVELFNDQQCRNLRGKPRMFFIQACRSRLDVQKDDEVDMGVEIPVRLVNSPSNNVTSSDGRGIYDDYTGRQPEEFRNNFYVASLDPRYRNSHVYGLSRQYTGNYLQTGNQYAMNVKSPEAREHPRRTTTYKVQKPEIEPETKPEDIEVFQIPCFNDFLVMFSSAAGTIAWSDSGKGGWLMYTLYHVFCDVTYTNKDLLTTLTGVCGMMATEMQTYCPSNFRYDKAKSAACVYHKLSKDIYLQPSSCV